MEARRLTQDEIGSLGIAGESPSISEPQPARVTTSPQVQPSETQQGPRRLRAEEVAGLGLAASEPDHGFASNVARGAGERAASLGSGLIDALDKLVDPVADFAESVLPLGRVEFGEDFSVRWLPHTQESIDAPGGLQDAVQGLREVDLGYQEGTTWEEVKQRPLSNVLPFAFEQGLISVPDMVAVMANLPGYVVARSGELGYDRAQNNNRDEATVQDFLEASPAAVSSAFLERLGARGMFGLSDDVTRFADVPGAAARAGTQEAATEAGQEGIEYLGTHVGTEAPVNLAEMGDQMAAGAVAGGPFGATVRTGTGLVEAANAPRPVQDQTGQVADVPVEPQQEVVSPAPAADPEPAPALQGIEGYTEQMPSFDPTTGAEEQGRYSPTTGDWISEAEYQRRSQPVPNRGDLQELLDDERPLSEIQAEQAEQQAAEEAIGTSESPAEAQDIDRAAAQTEQPSPAQAEAGNYKKGHVRIQGLDISIETPRGGERSGVDANGQPWSVQMPAHYGYVRRTEGADGDHVDVYIGENPNSEQVFVIDQIDADTKEFDEHKVMLGFGTDLGANRAYDLAFNDGRGSERLGSLTPMTMSEFKAWLKDGDTKKPLAYEKTPEPVPLLARQAVYDQVKTKVASLNPADIAQASGLDEADIRRALDERAARSAGIRPNGKGGYRRLPDRGPLELKEYIASQGGLRDDEGHGLKRQDYDKFLPGYGRMIRANGLPLDQMIERAWGAGYFGDSNVSERPDTATFLEALDESRHRDRPLYSIFDQGAILEREQKRQAEEEAAQEKAERESITELANQHKMELSDAEVDLALEYLRNYPDYTPEDALIEAVTNSANEAITEAENDGPADDIPFPDTKEPGGVRSSAEATDGTDLAQDGAVDGERGPEPGTDAPSQQPPQTGQRTEEPPDSVNETASDDTQAPADAGVSDSGEARLQSLGYQQDNPAVSRGNTDWIKEKQERAEEDFARINGITGATTAWFKRALNLPVDFVASLPGARNEVREPGDQQFDALMEAVERDGWKQDGPILIEVNHRGGAFITEGNTRAAVAKRTGQQTISAEVKWLNGGEEVSGNYTPDAFASLHQESQTVVTDGPVETPQDTQTEKDETQASAGVSDSEEDVLPEEAVSLAATLRRLDFDRLAQTVEADARKGYSLERVAGGVDLLVKIDQAGYQKPNENGVFTETSETVELSVPKGQKNVSASIRLHEAAPGVWLSSFNLSLPLRGGGSPTTVFGRQSKNRYDAILHEIGNFRRRLSAPGGETSAQQEKSADRIRQWLDTLEQEAHRSSHAVNRIPDHRVHEALEIDAIGYSNPIEVSEKTFSRLREFLRHNPGALVSMGDKVRGWTVGGPGGSELRLYQVSDRVALIGVKVDGIGYSGSTASEAMVRKALQDIEKREIESTTTDGPVQTTLGTAEQTLIPGTERSAKQAMQASDGRKKSDKAQKDMDVGLFAPQDTTGDLFEAPAKKTGAKKAAAKKVTTKAPDERIEDFGEKILGARKDTFTGFRDSLKEDVDLGALPLSKSFPQPNYEKLAEEGVDRRVLAAVAILRDAIPNKPRASYKLRRWVDDVEQIRGFAEKLLSGSLSVERFAEASRESYSLRPIPDTIEAISGVNADVLKLAAGYRVDSGSYSLLNGKRYNPSKTFWYLNAPNGRSASNPFSNDPAMRGTHREDRAEAISLAKKIIEYELAKTKEQPGISRKRSKYTDVGVYRDRTSKTLFLGFKVRSSVIRVKAGFADVKEARGYLEENRDDIQETIDAMRRGPNMRGEKNAPRQGEALREGDITPEMFSDTFGFRGVQFGNYVEGTRRQADLNRAFDALMDLADVLDIPPQALSLNGSLGLAFGARGHGGRRAAAAHYEPGEVVINLTKGSGPGSLAHEWLHGLDNYFGKQDGSAGYISERRTPKGGAREEVAAAWGEVRKSIEGGSFSERSSEFDTPRSKPYWNTTIEKAARSFERYIVDRLSEKGAVNDYLANIDMDGGAYPTAEEMQEAGIREAYDQLFNILETRETDQGIALYSRFGREKRVRTVEINSAEAYGGAKTARARKTALIGAIRSHRGHTVRNADTQKEIKIGRTGLEHTIRGAGPDLQLAATKLPDIIRVAQHVGTEADKDSRPNVTAVHKFEASVAIDNRPLDVLVTVIEDNHGNQFYDLAVMREGRRPVQRQKDKSVNLDRNSSRGTKENIASNSADFKEVDRIVRGIAERVAPQVQVETVSDLGTGSVGQYQPAQNLIRISLAATNPAETVHHEAVHALRAMGLFSKSEWDALSKRARQNNAMLARVDAEPAYASLDPEQRLEEAIAQEYAEWATKQTRTPRGVRKIYQRIKDFFERLSIWIRRARKKQDYRDVFAVIESGDIGSRDQTRTPDGRPMNAAAYHGTPHDFDQFSTDAIGTGEGAQAYGWGLYFASNREVAEHYKEALSGRSTSTPYYKGEAIDIGSFLGAHLRNINSFVNVNGMTLEEAKAESIEILQARRDYHVKDGNEDLVEEIDDAIHKITSMEQGDFELVRGRLFSVELTPSEEDYLYWDKPLSEQSEKVREALHNASLAHRDAHANQTGEEIYRATSRDMTRQIDDDYTWTSVQPIEDDRAASEALYAAGIPGIKYLDGSSRNRSLKEIKQEFLDQLPEDADIEDVSDLIGTGLFSPKYDAVLKALAHDDWLGFSYPAQAISAAFSNRINNWDPSPELLKAVSDTREDGTYNYVIFDDRSVTVTAKESRFNGSLPSEGDWKVLSTQRRAQLRRFKEAGRDALDRFRYSVQDRYIDLKRVQEAVAKARGAVGVAPDEDAYRAEELYHGRTGDRLRRFEEDTVEPLMEEIADRGLTIEDVDAYLYARHAPERNAEIAKINEGLPDGGSGMTNAEAEAEIARLRGEGKLDALKDIAKRIDGITAKTLKTRVDAGLMTQEQADTWGNKYKTYVPLRGFAELIDDVEDSSPNVGRGFDTRGPESKAALGRTSKAADILANVLTLHEEAIVRGEKNRVGQSFLELAQNNPNKDLWEVNQVKVSRRLNRETGMVEVDHRRNMVGENVLAVKKDGEAYHITIQHKPLAAAMKNVGGDTGNTVLRMLQQANRYLALVNTSANPEFIISNLIRDLQTAGINLQQFRSKGLTRDTLKGVARSMAAARSVMRGDGKHAWAGWYKEFAAEGGKTEFFGLDSLEEKRKAIQKKLADVKPSNARKAWKTLVQIERLIQDYNSVVENGVRLSLYVQLRERGVGKREAASAAKNLTVNFNRRGAMGPTFGALYLFFNASIQGSVILLQALKHRRVQKAVAGIVVLNAILDVVNGLLSDEDDDGEREYDKFNDHTLSYNMLIMSPWAEPGDDTQAVKIPLPYGYNVFANMGRMIGRGIRHGMGVGPSDYDPWSDAANLTAVAVESFNPIGGETDPMRTLVPTLLRPFYELETNENFAGIPIMPEENPFSPPSPDSERFFRSAPSWAVSASELLYESTGGSQLEEFTIDVSPETLDHFFKFAFGATGSFVNRTFDLTSDVITGETENLEWNDVPFARRVAQGPNRYWRERRYFDVREATQIARQEFRDQRGEDRREYREEYGPEIEAHSLFENADQALRQLRQRRNRIEDSASLSDEEKEDRIEDLRDSMNTIYANVLSQYSQMLQGRDSE